MLIESTTGLHEVDTHPFAATKTSRLYLTQEKTTADWRLLQVAASREHNGALERAAFVLTMLRETANLFDAAYTRDHEGRHLHYDRLYPEVVETGVSPEQGNRQINIYRLADIDDIRRVIPLANLRRRNRLRVDAETSAWVMGRLLKMLSFVHGEGIENRLLATGATVLLDPKQHFAITLDWSEVFIYQRQVPRDKATREIADAARAVFCSLGGDNAPGTSWQYGDEHLPYITLLRQLMTGEYSNAEKALDAFYKLVRREYGQSFHEFTTLPL